MVGGGGSAGIGLDLAPVSRVWQGGSAIAVGVPAHGIILDAGEVDDVQLSYRVDIGAWYNTTMSYNASSGLWEGVISGQLGDSIVEFFLIAHDIFHSIESTSIISYGVQLLLEGDLDGDGDVDIFDIVRAAGNYGKTLP